MLIPIFGIGVLLYIGYKWINDNKLTTLNKLGQLAEVFLSKNGISEAKHVCGNVYAIEYMRNGILNVVYIPIIEKLQKEFKNKQVFVNIKDLSVSIHQEPGVPYLIRPEDFDKEASISIYDENTDQLTSIINDGKIEL